MAVKVKKRPAYGTPDADSPELTTDFFARARPAADVAPRLVAGMAALAKKRGRPRLEKTKELVSLRLDPEIVAALKAGGKGWRTRVNTILSRALARKMRRSPVNRSARLKKRGQ